MPVKPVMLMILDGWGIRTMEHGNAVVLGHTPNYDAWTTQLERAIVAASEEAVGLVPDQMGNSEVGHLNLGAGRIVYQDISRINNAIKDGSFFEHETLLSAVERIKANGGKLHLFGLLGDGGVHAHDDHLHALLQFAKTNGIKPVIHIITDGRDTPPHSGIGFLQDLENYLADEQIDATIATVVGRYYIMDRDNRWERTAKANAAVVKRQGETAATPQQAIQQSYDADTTDEFILPTVIEGADTPVTAGDCLVFFNFRADRMRQIVRLLSFAEFENRPDVGFIDDLDIITMTQYEQDFTAQVLFPMEILKGTLAETLSNAGKTQFHIAETEKYPHVTYFFNGRNETPFPGEDRTIVPSPKVATYDLQPEMSAYEVTETILQRIADHDDDFLLINFANPDMVGHTGSLEAAIKAVETVDGCAKRIVDALVAKGGAAIVTADHGNCERMIDEVTGGPHTYHTTGMVPLFVLGNVYYLLRPTGKLADVAPTVLDLLGVPQPPEMTGRTLIEYKPAE